MGRGTRQRAGVRRRAYLGGRPRRVGTGPLTLAWLRPRPLGVHHAEGPRGRRGPGGTSGRGQDQAVRGRRRTRAIRGGPGVVRRALGLSPDVLGEFQRGTARRGLGPLAGVPGPGERNDGWVRRVVPLRDVRIRGQPGRLERVAPTRDWQGAASSLVHRTGGPG